MKTATREDWEQARGRLLEREKQHTRISDELARERRELPWLRVEKPTASTPPTARRPSQSCSASAPS